MSQFAPKRGTGQAKSRARSEQFRAVPSAYFTGQGLPKTEREQAAEKAASRVGRCKANEDTCKAYAVKGEDLCAGHMRSKEAQGEAGRTDNSDSDAA